MAHPDIVSPIKDVNPIHPFPPLSTICVDKRNSQSQLRQSQPSNASNVAAGALSLASVAYLTLHSMAIDRSWDDNKENIDFIVKTILDDKENEEVLVSINIYQMIIP